MIPLLCKKKPYILIIQIALFLFSLDFFLKITY